MSNQPKMRFKNYSSDWEQRKFSELYEKSSEKNDGSIGIDRNITVATMQFKPDVRVTEADYLKTYYTFNEGDIAFEGHQSKEFRYGRFVENDIGNGIVSHIFTVFRPTMKYDLAFWKYAINNERLMQGILSRSTKASTMMHDLVTEDFLNETFLVPSVEEQTLIGAFLKMLDGLITLHQRKLSKMKNIQASFLQDMFCAWPSDCPIIRFSEYTQAWKKSLLSSIVVPYTDYLPTPTDGYTRLGIRSHMKGTFYEYVAPSKQLGEKRLQRVKRDNFIVNIVFAWEHAIAVTTEEDEGKLVSHRFPQFSFRSGMYPRFFHYALNNERFRHHLWLASPSGAGRNKTLRIDEMLEYELHIPEYEEQKKIADFLTSLDGLIDLYDCRVKKLQNVKQACLQGMFV